MEDGDTPAVLGCSVGFSTGTYNLEPLCSAGIGAALEESSLGKWGAKVATAWLEENRVTELLTEI